MRYRFSVWGGVACIAIAGCGGSGDQLDTYSVTGVVTYNGSAVEGASIGFVPEEAGKPSAFGRTDSDGTYTLTTYEADDGAPAGAYTVTVTKFEVVATAQQGSGTDESDPNYVPPPDNPAPTPPPKSLVPKKYNSAKTSDLTRDVAESDNTVDIELVD